jgi:DNA-binding CsgD family transcriptional regulator/tetratricopeptide (TPR) repeat protein
MDQALAGTGSESATDPLRGAQVVERRAFVLRALGRDEEAAGQLREALTLLPAQPVTVTHAVVLASLANSLMRSDEAEQSRDIARSAVDAAAAVGATAQQADALITLGSAAGYLGDPQTGLAELREGLALADRHELHGVALRGYTNLSDHLEMLGRHTEAAEVATAGITLAVRVGHARSHGAMLVGNLAEPLIRLGRWREALDLITESLADDPNGIFASTLLLLRGELQLWQGDAAAAEHDVQEARRQFGGGTDVQFTAPMVFIEAELARARGELTDARQRVHAALDGPVTGFWVRYAWPLLWLGMRIEADIAATSTPAGAQRREALHTQAAALQAGTPPAQAYKALIAAETARLSGQGEVAAWHTAVAATRSAGEAFPLCYSLYRLAEAQSADPATGTDTAVSATALECLRLADDLAAATADDVRALARRARLRIEPTPPATADVPSQQPDLRFRLTDREREVLALVAEGRSNGQIAGTLYISPKTVSVHVSNILAKLGTSTRTEAAMVAYRLGILPAA